MDRGDTILLASDHNGNEARRALVEHVARQRNVNRFDPMEFCPVDLGPRAEQGKVDYVSYALQVAHAVAIEPRLRGILICGTGIGMSIAANRVPGVKASLVHDVFDAQKTREHNDSNVLVLGAWKTPIAEMREIVDVWLAEDFGKGRHHQRVERLNRNEGAIVLVPGVFELLTVPHLALFEFAKSIGKVVVALNSQESAERLKGRKMVVSEEGRRRLVSAVKDVDEVVVFDGEVGVLSEALGATHVVKGGNYIEENVRAADHIPEGIEVRILPFVGVGVSSGDIRSMLKGTTGG